MQDHELFDEEVREAEVELQADLEKLGTLQGAARAEKAGKIADKLKKAKKNTQTLKAENRGLQDPNTKKEYEKRAKAHDHELGRLTNMLNELRTAQPPGGAAADVSPRGGAPVRAGPRITDESRSAGRKIAKETEGYQDEALAAVRRGQKTVQETEDTAEEVTGALGRQTERLQAINEDLSTLEGNINRAKREVNAFARRMMTDKLILAMMFLMLCGVLFIIGWKLFGPKKGDSPPPPVASQ